MLNVVMLSSFNMLSTVIMITFIMLSVITLRAIRLSVNILSVVLLRVVEPGYRPWSSLLEGMEVVSLAKLVPVKARPFYFS